MQYPLKIDNGIIKLSYKISSVKSLIKQINSWALKPTKYFMSQSDYYDILKWSKGA